MSWTAQCCVTDCIRRWFRDCARVNEVDFIASKTSIFGVSIFNRFVHETFLFRFWTSGDVLLLQKFAVSIFTKSVDFGAR